MTRDKFIKYRFKAYMGIDFKHPELCESVECILVNVNFDTEIFILRPFPGEHPFIDDNDFAAHISHCELTRHKIKVLK